MKRIQNISDTTRFNIAILILRLSLGIALFINHGIEKIHFQEMKEHFPDPLNIGVLPGLLLAFFTDVICSVLVALGLFTRILSGVIVFNLLIAFIFFHKLNLTTVLGEQAYLYLFSYTLIFLCGGGKYSADYLIKEKNRKTRL